MMILLRHVEQSQLPTTSVAAAPPLRHTHTHALHFVSFIHGESLCNREESVLQSVDAPSKDRRSTSVFSGGAAGEEKPPAAVRGESRAERRRGCSLD